jgi:transposase
MTHQAGLGNYLGAYLTAISEGKTPEDFLQFAESKVFPISEEKYSNLALCRDYGRSTRGKKIKSDISGKKSERTSLISGWFHQAKEFVASYVFKGYTDATRFNEWLEKCLIPNMKTGQTLVLDNASFHKGKKTRELIEAAGCKLLYLPPYSPDFNPIEKQWATLKRNYRTFKHRVYEHQNAIDASFT